MVRMTFLNYFQNTHTLIFIYLISSFGVSLKTLVSTYAFSGISSVSSEDSFSSSDWSRFFLNHFLFQLSLVLASFFLLGFFLLLGRFPCPLFLSVFSPLDLSSTTAVPCFFSKTMFLNFVGVPLYVYFFYPFTPLPSTRGWGSKNVAWGKRTFPQLFVCVSILF